MLRTRRSSTCQSRRRSRAIPGRAVSKETVELLARPGQVQTTESTSRLDLRRIDDEHEDETRRPADGRGQTHIARGDLPRRRRPHRRTGARRNRSRSSHAAGQQGAMIARADPNASPLQGSALREGLGRGGLGLDGSVPGQMSFTVLGQIGNDILPRRRPSQGIRWRVLRRDYPGKPAGKTAKSNRTERPPPQLRGRGGRSRPRSSACPRCRSTCARSACDSRG